jgi:hypothetical protein
MVSVIPVTSFARTVLRLPLGDFSGDFSQKELLALLSTAALLTQSCTADSGHVEAKSLSIHA